MSDTPTGRIIVVDCTVTEYEDGHQVNRVAYHSDVPDRLMHEVCGSILGAIHDRGASDGGRT